MWFGPDTKVRLNVDLTRYHSHLTEGAVGTLLHGVTVDQWTSLDNFGAVRFDCCGHLRSIVLKSLDIPPDAPRAESGTTIMSSRAPRLVETHDGPVTAQKGVMYHGFLIEDRGFDACVARDAGRTIFLRGLKPNDVKMKVRAYRKYGEDIAEKVRSLLAAEGIPVKAVGFDATTFDMSWTFRTDLPEDEAGKRVRYALPKPSSKSGRDS